MPRTISDQEYDMLQQRRAIADLVEPVYNHPKWGKDARRLLKNAYPNLPIPDLDIADEVNARLDAEKKEREEKEAAVKKAEADKKAAADRDEWQKQRAEIQKQYRYTDETMGKLEQWMKENFVGNYQVAAKAFASEQPMPIDSTYDPHLWHHDRADGFAEIARDPEAWGRNEIMRALRAEEQRARGGR